MNPVESRVAANHLHHHVLTWNDAERAEPTIVLLHGFLDMAWSFRDLANLLADAGHRVVAFDFRGHGESEWVGHGGYYHFADYVLDLDELLPKIAPTPVHLVAHSMGGSVAALYAASRPAMVRTLTLAEGLGPPEHPTSFAIDKMRAWLDGVARVRQASLKPIASIEEAFMRMRVQNPQLPEELGLFLAEKGTRELQGGGRMWSFDPLHRTTSPTLFRRDVYDAFISSINMPTLLIRGEHGYRTPDDDERSAVVPNATMATIKGAHHMMHWTHAPDFARLILDFIHR
ncbi:MAG: alpha/beta hydrolase [Sandaracinaceae bacterium]|nr:alpha/beta hydrolase [Sandaracinaceae bacterium]